MADAKFDGIFGNNCLWIILLVLFFVCCCGGGGLF